MSKIRISWISACFEHLIFGNLEIVSYFELIPAECSARASYFACLSMWQQDCLHCFFAFHRPEGFIRLIQSEGMGDQFFEVLGVSQDELKGHVSMTHLAYPDSLEPEVFPSDIMKTIELHRSMRLPEASRQTRATRSN